MSLINSGLRSLSHISISDSHTTGFPSPRDMSATGFPSPRDTSATGFPSPRDTSATTITCPRLDGICASAAYQNPADIRVRLIHSPDWIDKKDILKFITEDIKQIILKHYGGLESANENIIRIVSSCNPSIFKNITPETIFYSATQSMLNSVDRFETKEICWMSDLFNQSLLHPFNGIRLTYKQLNLRGSIKGPPLELSPEKEKQNFVNYSIYKFRLNNIYRIINSTELSNINIFKDLIEDELLSKLIEYFIINNRKLKVINCDDDITISERIFPIKINNIFNKENNIYILYILNGLNYFLPLELKIYGYMNYFDQRETALIDFNSLIDISTIQKSTIVQFIQTEKSYDFPIKPKDLIKALEFNGSEYLKDYPEYTNYARMALVKNHIIRYTDFDNESNILEYHIEDIIEYFKNKYLKYKIKYNNLYNILS